MKVVTRTFTYPHCRYFGTLADENASRLVSFFTVALVFVAATTPARWLVAVAFLDSLWRALVTTAPSPLMRLALWIVGGLGIEPQPTRFAPRLFAERLEAVLTAAVCAFFASGDSTASAISAAALIVVASLDAFAGVCVGGGLYEAWRSTTDRSDD